MGDMNCIKEKNEKNIKNWLIYYYIRLEVKKSL